MKVLFLTNNLVLPGQPGIPRPWEIAKHLRRSGHDVTVITNRSHYLNEDIRVGGPPDAPVEIEGVRVIGMRTTRGRRRSVPRRLLNYLSVGWGFWRAGRRQARPDLLIVSVPPPLVVAFAGWLLRRRFRCPAILDIRDLYPHSAVGLGAIRHPVPVRLWQWAETFLQSRYDHLVAAVPRMKNMLAEQGFPPARVTVITNGYDAVNDSTAPLPDDVADFLEGNRERFIACYGGSMGYANDVGAMIGAAGILADDPRFVFAIFGDGDRKRLYARDIEVRGLRNVRLFPAQPRAVIGTVFRRASALLHGYRPSSAWDYALPNKIFDYHGAGRPIVFAGNGEVADLMKAAGSGLVTPPGEARAMADALRWLADHPEEAEAMGRRGRAFIIAEYSRDRVFARWDEAVAGAQDPAAPPTGEG